MEQQTYQVTPYDSKGRCVGRSVYLRAATQEKADRGGELLLRAFGQRGRFRVASVPYNPLYDREMRGYVCPVEPQAIS